MALGAAILFARRLDGIHKLEGWFFFELASVWLWELYLLAACFVTGLALVDRLLPADDRGALDVFALSYPAGLVVFGLGMYVGGALWLFRPAFAVLWPAVMLLASARPALRAWTRAREAGAFPAARLSRLALVGSIAGLFGLGVLYLGAMSPVAVNYDASWMHLAIAQDYAREGHLIAYPGNWELDFPHFASVIHTWDFLVPGLGHHRPSLRWMMALHTELAAVIWTMAGVAATCRFLVGREVAGTWCAFLLFPGIFVYDNNIGGAADHFVALYAASLLFLTARVMRRFDRGACLLWGGLAGAAISTKYQALYLIVPLGGFICVRLAIELLRRARGRGDALAPRRLVAGLAAMAAGGIVVFSPYLVANIVFFRNPFFPFLQNLLPDPHGVIRDAATQVSNQAADWHWRAPAQLGERISKAIEMMFTFSFAPHYSFTGDAPNYGSTFTLALPLLLFIQKSRRLWYGALVCLGALYMWASTYWVDRNLQTFMPALAAVTAAILIRAWELGWAARLGVTALVLIQLAWGSAFIFSGTDRIMSSLNLLRDGFDGHAREQLRNTRSEFVSLGESLPENAKVMVHASHPTLGIDRPVILDWLGFQGLIDYGPMRTPGDLYDRLKRLGVTDVVFLPGSHPAASRQAEAIFDLFTDEQGAGVRHYGELAVFHLSSPPNVEPALKVLMLGMPDYADGLYPVEDLAVNDEAPPALRRYPNPSRRAPLAAPLLDEARVALVGSGTALDPETSEHLSRQFHEFQTYTGSFAGFRALIRNH